MARTLTGTLLLPDNTPAANAKVFLTAKRVETVSIVSGMSSSFTTDDNGTYSQEVVTGYYDVSIEFPERNLSVPTRRWPIGVIVVDDTTTPISLNQLIINSTQPDDISLTIFYDLLAQTTEQAEAAGLSASAAAVSATSASTSSTSAGNSATAAQTARLASEAARDLAQAAASTASTAAASAEDSANDAGIYRDLAQQWATNPEDVAVVTGQYSAFHWATKAADSAIVANTAAVQAAADAEDAANSAETAETEAAAALAERQLAEIARTGALTAAGSASAYADTAHNDAAAAALSAMNANNSATTAGTHAANAATSATSAGNSAVSANNAANVAIDNAADSETARIAAQAAQVAAATAQAEAENSATSSYNWANTDEDVVVPGSVSEFSAKHWAAKAEAAAGGLDLESTLDGIVTKQGGAFTETDTLREALQTIVDAGIGSTNTYPETLDNLTSFADLWALPQNKTFIVTSNSNTAHFLETITATTTYPYAGSSIASNLKDIFIKIASIEYSTTSIFRKLVFIYNGIAAQLSPMLMQRRLCLVQNVTTGTVTCTTNYVPDYSDVPVTLSDAFISSGEDTTIDQSQTLLKASLNSNILSWNGVVKLEASSSGGNGALIASDLTSTVIPNMTPAGVFNKAFIAGIEESSGKNVWIQFTGHGATVDIDIVAPDLLSGDGFVYFNGSYITGPVETVFPDIIPNDFTFTDVTYANLNEVYTSNPITVTGIGAGVAAPISITGGSYSINSSSYTTSPGIVYLNDVITVQVTSSNAHGTSASATLNINGVTDIYTVTTIADGLSLPPSNMVVTIPDGETTYSSPSITGLPEFQGNEPAGMSTGAFSSRIFNTGTDGTWWGSVPVVATDSPFDDGNGLAGRVTYPVGHPGGEDAPAGTGYTWDEGSAPREIYMCFDFTTSLNWQPHPSGTNKIFYITNSGANPAFISLETDQPTPQIQIRNQGMAVYTPTNPNLETVGITYGETYLVEVHLVSNSAVGTADGEAHLWVNGVKTTEYTGLEWNDTNFTFNQVLWGPIWGGGGSTVSEEMFQEISQLYVSYKMADEEEGIQLGSGEELHVAKTGNDTTGDGSIGAPFLTINKAMSVVEVGGTISVHAENGDETIYSEETATSAYVPAQTWFGHPVAVGARISGTVDNRCTLRAYPGDEGLITIDGNNTQIGIHANDHDYWNIYGLRIKNCREEGIINNGQVPDHVPNLTNLSTGWRIENCLVDTVAGAEGNNVSGIAPWGTKDWVIRNCKIKNVSADASTVASAIQTYGTINLLVEHVATDNVEFGIFLKDHFLETDTPRTPYPGVEVRYCRLKTLASAINIGIRGAGSCEAGDQYIHHNVMYGFDGTTEEAVQARMAGAEGQSKRLRLKHNTIDIAGGATEHFVASAFDDIELYGNILCGGSIALSTHFDDGAGQITRITDSDYNVYTNFQAILNRYGTNSTTFSDLPSWQAATAGTPQHLGVSGPDANSIEALTTELFTDRAGNVYTNASSSPALALLPDGSNAGAYQIGSETIGLLSTYTAGE